jgi:hypothetical protein
VPDKYGKYTDSHSEHLKLIAISTAAIVTRTHLNVAFYLLSDQYNETKVKHFSFSLLRIKGLYMFRALLAHPQQDLHKRPLV